MTVHVVLRADASAEKGLGHAMRCLALAQGLKDLGVEVELAAKACPDELVDRFAREGVHVRRVAAGLGIDAELAAVTAELGPGGWVVLDGYDLDAAYAAAASRTGARVLVLDDDAARPPMPCDALLNPNLHARAETYAAWNVGALWLGTQFTPMRREFRAPFRKDPEAGRVLLTMGGSDPPGLTLALLGPLALALPDATIDVVVGAANPRRKEIEAAAAPHARVNVLTDVRTMSEVMGRCALAVSAAGSTAWELAAMGVPMALVSLADNQRPVASALAASEAALDLGFHPGPYADGAETALAVAVRAFLNDPPRARTFAQNARRIVDGRGALRVAALLSNLDPRLADGGALPSPESSPLDPGDLS